MSLRKWINSSSKASTSDERALEAASKAVKEVRKEQNELSEKGRKTTNGNKKVLEKFTEYFGFPVSEATVRNYKREMQKLLKEEQDLESIEVPTRKRGRPFLLPNEIDQLTKTFILVDAT